MKGNLESLQKSTWNFFRAYLVYWNKITRNILRYVYYSYYHTTSIGKRGGKWVIDQLV